MNIQEQIDKVVNCIINKYKPDKIILFGSYAYGQPGKNSDLDLLIVKDSHLPRYRRAREVRKYLWGITDIPKDIIVYTQAEIDEWQEVAEAFITQIIKNGRVLYEDKSRVDKRLA